MPESPLEVYLAHTELFEYLVADFDDHIFCVMGDSNLPNLVWNSIDDCGYLVSVNVSCAVEETICAGSSISHILGCFGSLVDVCFANCRSVITEDNPVVSTDLYHPAIISAVLYVVGDY